MGKCVPVGVGNYKQNSVDVLVGERPCYYSIGGLGGTYFTGKFLLLKGKVIVVL